MRLTHRLVPDFIYQKYHADDFYGSFQSAAIFVDLSGFSAMTDALSVHGARGAEALADMMRVVFEPLVNAVYMQGGFVIGYAGDAFNAVFPVGERERETETARRCLAAAWSMQSHAKAHALTSTPYGNFSIRLKVGVGFGATTWQIFRSANGRRASYWFRGQSLSGAVAAEEAARAGDVVLDGAARRLLGDEIAAAPAADCFLLQDVLFDLPLPQPLPPPPPEDGLAEVFFAETVTRQPMVGEFRQAVNLFIDIPIGITDQALIKPFMETVYRLQEQYGGFFLRPDLGDKGFNLLMFWGAPTAHENDVERALNFLLELSAQTGIALRAGISYRMAYTGFIGSTQREDYTAYGWGVTLAARMMERAGAGEYWMDAETASRAEKRFQIKPLGEHKFKGFQRGQKIFALLGRKPLAETVYQGRLVGRRREFEALSDFFQPLRRGEFAGVMILTGEAGIGKSRLAHSFQISAYFQDFPAQWALCQTDEILRLPFNPFAAWLKKRFGLTEGQDEETGRARFSSVLQRLIDSTPDPELAAELSRTASVLAALVNISMPGSLYESLDAKGRYENTLIALDAFLRAESMRQPLVLFVEDIHWLDGDSRVFLTYFARALLAEPRKRYPIAILVTRRPEEEFSWMGEQVALREMHLDKLAAEDLSQLAADILSHPVSDSLLALLNSRAEGNPFFAEQILRYLAEQNALELDAGGNYAAKSEVDISLPTDVRSVLIARLDRLGGQVREMAQTASALGREFEVRVLREMLNEDGDFQRHLAQAEQARIWAPLSEISYIFRHALFRDAAYSMQLLARRRELHRLALSAMETVYRGEIEPRCGQLAYHAERAELREKALYYLNLAGKLALGVYQNQQAIDYLTRALSFVRQEDGRVQFDLLLLRAEAYYNLGDTAKQAEDLVVLENLAVQIGDESLLSRAFMRRAYYFSALAEFQKALEYALPARDIAIPLREVEVIIALSTLIPSALLRLGKVSEALRYAEEGLAFARSVRHRQGEGKILTMLGLISIEKEGAAAAAQRHEQALAIGREIGDRYLEAMALSNLAYAMGISQSDYPAALDYFQQAYSIACELGNGKGQAVTLSNIGWLKGLLGDYPAAIQYSTQALSILRRIGESALEINIYLNLSAAAGAQGKAQESLTWAQEALSLAKKLEDRAGCAWAYFYLGHARLINGQLDEAVGAFLQSLQIRSDIGAPALKIEARAGLLEAYLHSGDLNAAQAQAEQILDYMSADADFEGAEEPFRIFWTLFRFLENAGDPRAQAVLQNAVRLLNARVSKLPSEDARRAYVEGAPWRREILRAVKAGSLAD